MTTLNFPEPIAAYFDADKRGDADAVARCFTKVATVKDEGRKHSGRAAIQAWKTGTSAKYSYTSQPLALEQRDGGYVVTCRLTGDFPGSPVDLRYAFRLARGKIASLEITV
ncbi:MAG TPA: nuclear transport factor 2 family protein [Gammaproteobacteria bacterium]|nr:nuclear transport factor 2 family protein [Gammaproteobacteria bacterium]